MPNNIAPKRVLWVEAALGAAVAIGLGGAVWHHHGPLMIEQKIAGWIEGPALEPSPLALRPPSHWVFALMVAPGEPEVLAAAIASLVFISWRKHDPRLSLFCLAAPTVAAVLTEWVGKPLVHRLHQQSLAYPSGHATASTALALVTYTAIGRLWSKKAALLFAPFAMLIALSTGIGVLALHWHYIADVVGGWAVGVAASSATAATVLRRQSPRT